MKTCWIQLTIALSAVLFAFGVQAGVSEEAESIVAIERAQNFGKEDNDGSDFRKNDDQYYHEENDHNCEDVIVTNTVSDTITQIQTQTLTDIIVTTTTTTAISTPTLPTRDVGTCYVLNTAVNDAVGALLTRIYSYPQDISTTGTDYAFSYDQCESLCVASPETNFNYFSLTNDKGTSTGQVEFICSCFSNYTPATGTGSCEQVSVNGVSYTYGSPGSEFVFALT